MVVTEVAFAGALLGGRVVEFVDPVLGDETRWRVADPRGFGTVLARPFQRDPVRCPGRVILDIVDLCAEQVVAQPGIDLDLVKARLAGVA